jgi:hypothetical protein
MMDCKLVSTPVETQVKVSATFGPPVADPTQFRSLVGALQYIIFTRPTSSTPSSKFVFICMIPESLTSPR